MESASDVLSDIRRKCTEGDPAQHEACFLDAMKSAGASDEAMAFVKEFAANGLAYVRAFRDTGRVDIAYIEYLFRANDLDGVLLVNGTPPIIDVDDYKFLSQEDLRKNDDYAALLQNIPTSASSPATATIRSGRRPTCWLLARNSKLSIFFKTAATPARESALSSWPSTSILPGASRSAPDGCTDRRRQR